MVKRNNSAQIIIKIGKLWNSGEGTTEKIDMDVPVSFEDAELNPLSNLTGELMLVKLKNEISAIVKNFKITLRVNCVKCLKEFKKQIIIPEVAREFLGGKIGPDDDPNENFQINFDTMSIDLHEMVRQEIFLHFPLISVCSKSCKGICPICKKDRNKTKCSCKIEEIQENKPFKELKKLIS